MKGSDQLHSFAALFPGESDPGTYGIGGWVDTRDVLEAYSAVSTWLYRLVSVQDKMQTSHIRWASPGENVVAVALLQ
jgi:hypothetical protein